MKLQAHSVAWTVLWGLVSQWVDDLLKQQLYNKTSKWPTLWERYFCLLESLIFHQFAKLWIRNWFIFHRSCIINHELIKNPVVKVAGYSRWIATLSGILSSILWNAVLTHPAVLSMNKIRERDELRAPNRWGARFDFATKTAPIYSLDV